MTALPQNDGLAQIRDAGYHPLKVRIFRDETIVYLSGEEIERMIHEWCKTKKQPEGLFICADAGGWTACEG